MGGLPPKFKIPTFFSVRQTTFLGKGGIQRRITRPQILQSQIHLLKYIKNLLSQQVLKTKHRTIVSQFKASRSNLGRKISILSITIFSKQILFLRTLSKIMPQIIRNPVSWMPINVLTLPKIKAQQSRMVLITSKNHFSLRVKISLSHHSLHQLQRANHLYSANQLHNLAQIHSSKIKPLPLGEHSSLRQTEASHQVSNNNLNQMGDSLWASHSRLHRLSFHPKCKASNLRLLLQLQKKVYRWLKSQRILNKAISFKDK